MLFLLSTVLLKGATATVGGTPHSAQVKPTLSLSKKSLGFSPPQSSLRLMSRAREDLRARRCSCRDPKRALPVSRRREAWLNTHVGWHSFPLTEVQHLDPKASRFFAALTSRSCCTPRPEHPHRLVTRCLRPLRPLTAPQLEQLRGLVDRWSRIPRWRQLTGGSKQGLCCSVVKEIPAFALRTTQ